MGEAGRRAVLGRSWENVCATLFDYYQQVIDESLARRAETLVPAAQRR